MDEIDLRVTPIYLSSFQNPITGEVCLDKLSTKELVFLEHVLHDNFGRLYVEARFRDKALKDKY